MKPTSVLVIDDDSDILDALRFVLEDSGYNVITSEKAEYAERLLQTKGTLPDLIILDVLLSGQDGRMICRMLKRNAETKHIPIIMISAHPGADKSVKSVGADAFLAKPFDIDSLLKQVSGYLPS